jgi:hypothetical protein
MWANPVYRDAFVAGLKNQTVSAETRKKISATLRTPEVAALISRAGSVQSPETRLKISNSTKNVPKTEVTKLRMASGANTRWDATPMPVRCVEMGVGFHSARYAEAWLRLLGMTNSACANSTINTAIYKGWRAYGFHWEWIDINEWDIPNKRYKESCK